MKIITWNMLGASDNESSKWPKAAKQFILKRRADVVCLQECGWPLANEDFEVVYADQIEPLPRPVRFLNSPDDVEYKQFIWRPFNDREENIGIYVLWIRLDDGGNRVNLAIMSVEKPSYYIYIEPVTVREDFSTRPAIGMGIGVRNIFCIHANSRTRGADAPKLIETINSRYRSWYAAGDFNRQPDDWNEDNGVIWPPDRPTHDRYGYLDYMVAYVGRNRGTVFEKPVHSDHYPVEFEF